MTWTNDIASILEAVANRMIPKDEWPSATEEGVLSYLERHATEDAEVWNKLIVPGLRELEQYAKQRFQKSFQELTESQQDQLLLDIEDDEVQGGWSVSPKLFFTELLSYVAEGYYGSSEDSDSIRKSWEMIGFHPDPLSQAQEPADEMDMPQQTIDELEEQYDAIVVGAGAGGATAAGVLAESGLRVLIVERGSFQKYDEMGRDHTRNHRLSKYGHNTGPELEGHPRTIQLPNGELKVTAPHEADYHNNAMAIGGGTRVYGAQAWRFHPDDFRMASKYGVPDGSSLSDWPFSYDELERYYDRAEWEIGVSGNPNAHPGRGKRTRPFPMPPLAETLEAKQLAKGAEKLGWEVGPVPLLINSVDYDGRPACIRCGQCVGFACPSNSKNGGHNTMLVRAINSGNCDLICDTMAERIETEGGKRATGVHLIQSVGDKVQRRFIRAEHVVVAGGAIESARLLLNSATNEEPNGIGNRYDQVGRNLQGHVYAGAYGLFDDPVQDGLGPGVSISTARFAHGNDNIIGGGIIANEFTRLPIVHWYRALAPDVVRWGLKGKEIMRDSYLRTSQVQGPIQEIPTADSRVQLSPTVKDRFGVPVVHLSGTVHQESINSALLLAEKSEEWLWASGARQVWRTRPGVRLSGGQHQAGTLRMGNNPESSVTDPHGRVHGYDNLWVSDGSLHVTNGGVNPVLTIFALAFRTADNLIKQS